MVSAAVLAHQGGWDEVVLVLLPLVVLAGLLRMARRRALQETEEGDDDHVADGAATRPSDPGPGTDR
jgi:hypothetical protein